MAVGRISGPLLKDNLLRNGVDLAFETDLLYLDVINGRVGINTKTPTNELSVNGTTKTTNLQVTTQADIATFTITGDTISSSSDTINLVPSGVNPVVYQAKVSVDGDLRITSNTIETTVLDSDLYINAAGAGQVFVNRSVRVNGDVHATGNITADGSITIGDSNTDNITFKADVNSDIIPNIANTFDLGSDPATGGKEWANVYAHNVHATNFSSTTITVDGINLILEPGNILFVAKNGDDTFSGTREFDPFYTIKHALSVATAGTTVYVYPGTYTEEFPLVVPAGVTIKGAGLRAVTVQPTLLTNSEDGFLLNGESTVEDLTISNFFYNNLDNTGYGFRFANNLNVTSRSPYVRNCSVITKGSIITPQDPLGFNAGDAGRGALIDGSVANSSSKEASMLFHAVTMITAGADAITATNGVRVEWVNGFTYHANRGLYATNGTQGFAGLGVKFGAEIRSIGSAYVYGNYGAYGDGDSVIGYLIGQNFSYVGSGKLATNDPQDRIPANEVVEQNSAHLYFTSNDNAGTYKLGGNFEIHQNTNDVLFNAQNLIVNSAQGISITDGTHTTLLLPAEVDTGNIKISSNTIESVAGDLNVTAASGIINLQNNTFITGNLDITGDFTIGGNITIGDQTTDTINFVAGIDSNLVPAQTATYDLGTTDLRWNTLYVSRVEVDGLVIDNNTIGTSVGNDNLILTANGTGIISVPTNNVVLGQDLTVNGSTYVHGTTITGDVTQTGDVVQTGNYTQTGDATITGNLTVSTFGQFEKIRVDGNVISTTAVDTNLVLEANGTGIIYIPTDDVQIDQNLTVNGTISSDNLTVTQNVTALGFSDGDILIQNNEITTQIANHDLILSASGTGIVIVPSNDVLINQALTVNGSTTLKDTTIVGTVTQTGDVVQTGNYTQTGDTTITGNLTVSTFGQFEKIRIDGNIISTTAANTNLVLEANGTGIVHIPNDNVQIDQNLTVVGNISSNSLDVDTSVTAGSFNTGDILIQNNEITTQGTDHNLILRANGTGIISIPTNDVQIDQSVTTDGNLTVTTGTTYLKAVDVTGDITQTGDLNQTGNITSSGNLDVTGSITGGGDLILPQITITNNIVQVTEPDTNLDLRANGTGDIVFEDIRVTNNNIQAVVENADLILTPQGSGSVVANTNQSLIIPVGSDAQRPLSPENGMIRYNIDRNRYEGYNAAYNAWMRLSGVEDLDGNTKITAELTPGSNDNIIRFYINGVVTTTIDSSKLETHRFQTSGIDIHNDTISAIGTNADINLVTSGTGSVKIGNLSIKDNAITNVISGAVTEFTEVGTGYVKISGVRGVVIPVGDNVNRPLVPTVGMMRFNTSYSIVEIWDGANWINVSGTASGINIAQATELGIASALVFG